MLLDVALPESKRWQPFSFWSNLISILPVIGTALLRRQVVVVKAAGLVAIIIAALIACTFAAVGIADASGFAFWVGCSFVLVSSINFVVDGIEL